MCNQKGETEREEKEEVTYTDLKNQQKLIRAIILSKMLDRVKLLYIWQPVEIHFIPAPRAKRKQVRVLFMKTKIFFTVAADA